MTDMAEPTGAETTGGSDIHRPELHVTADAGVLMAPAAVMLDGRTWHLFHQYRPSLDAPARWGHQFSEDNPYEWETCDDVLAAEGDETLVRAGSVVAADGGFNVYFTSVTASGTAVHLARIDDPAATTTDISDDPLALDPQVVRRGEVVGNAQGEAAGLFDFRSPCVVPDWASDSDRDEGLAGWLMLSVTGAQDSPQLAVLRSADGVDWHLDGPLVLDGDSGLEAETQVVSPRIIRLRDEVDGEIYDIILVTIEHDGIDISGYLVGRLTGATFTVSRPFHRIDFGHDFTRPRNTNLSEPADPRWRRGAIVGALNGVGRFDDPAKHLSWTESGWANAVSVPRVVSLQGGMLFQTPAAGLVDAVTRTDHARMWTALCEIPVGSELSVDILDAAGETAARVTHQGDVLELDRSMNPHHAGDGVARAPLAEGDSDSLTILVDGSTVEVFADGGAVAMASRVYVDGGAQDFRVSLEGEAQVEKHFTRGPETISPVIPEWAAPRLDTEFR